MITRCFIICNWVQEHICIPGKDAKRQACEFLPLGVKTISTKQTKQGLLVVCCCSPYQHDGLFPSLLGLDGFWIITTTSEHDKEKFSVLVNECKYDKQLYNKDWCQYLESETVIVK